MPDMTTMHPDHFTLLFYLAGELVSPEQGAADEHLGNCQSCKTVLVQLRELDQQLRALATNPEVRCDWQADALPPHDPFYQRPLASSKRVRRLPTPDATSAAIRASDEAVALRDGILAKVTGAEELTPHIQGPITLAERFALLYALQEAGHRIAANPKRFQEFAEASIAVLTGQDQATTANVVVPQAMLFAQAHQLAGQAQLWSGELQNAGEHFQIAYQGFGSLGDVTSMARVEQLESQRRFFAGHGAEALMLAERATITFEALGLVDEWARARGAQGMALFQLARWQESADAFAAALPVFEQQGLWSNYVGTLNSSATALVKMGRLAEARREYARALRRFSRTEHRSWLPFIRKGLAEVLFSAGQYRHAALEASQAARLYHESGQVSRFLLTLLFEVESWARAGDAARARHRLDLFRTAISRHNRLDPTLAALVQQAMSGTSPDFREIVNLREQADATLDEPLGASA
jgi:tetratricopeptide (TPR) repeat protein